MNHYYIINDDIYYIIIVSILILLIVFYGGHNNIDKIDYDSNYFFYIKKITSYKNKFINYSNTLNFNENDHYIIDNLTSLINIYIPNIKSILIIQINPYNIFDIYKIFNVYDTLNNTKYLMIIFNFNEHKNIDILIHKKNNLEYFYNVDKNLLITNIYDIYNRNNYKIFLGILFIKKPFWYY